MGFLDEIFRKNENQESIESAKTLKPSHKAFDASVEKLLAAIAENKEMREKISALCSMDFLTEIQPLASLEYDFTYSLDGEVFAEDGCGGYYVLLQDASVGYIGFAENECGRVAMSLKEMLELQLNCAFSWHNYGLRYLELDHAAVLQFEETGKEEFEDAYSLPYISVRDDIAKALDLYIATDIYVEILPKFYNAATLEPKFTANSGEMKMDDIVM